MAAPDPSIVIATPCLDGNVNAHYAGALVKTMALLNQRGIRCEIQFEIGNSLIADARNKLVAKFLSFSFSDIGDAIGRVTMLDDFVDDPRAGRRGQLAEFIEFIVTDEYCCFHLGCRRRNRRRRRHLHLGGRDG